MKKGEKMKEEKMKKHLERLKKQIKVKNSGFLYNVLKKLLNKNVGAIALFGSFYDFRTKKTRSLISQLQTYSHEGTHIIQQKKDKFFYFKYAYPQVLAVFSLFSFSFF